MDFYRAKLIPFFFSLFSQYFPKPASKMALQLFMQTQKIPRGPTETKFWKSGRTINLPSKLDIKGYGNPSDPQIWIIHGWNARSSQLRSIIEALAVQQYFVIAWDGPAHGNNSGHKTHLVEFANMLEVDLKAYGKPGLTLIGHSFGGAVAAYVTSRNKNVKNLITIASPSNMMNVFENFWNYLHLSKEAQNEFMFLARDLIKIDPNELSMVTFYKNIEAKWLHIHDKNDDSVNFKNATELQALNYSLMSFLYTENLGHHKILKNNWVITKIAQFLKSGRIS